MSFFNRIKQGLTKTRANLTNKLFGAFTRHKYITEDLYEELEEILITADISATLVFELLEELREKANKDRIKDVMVLYQLLQDMMAEYIPEASPLNLADNGISVILVVGVNGVGKTTSIGKIAATLNKQGKKVMLVAADTFRAGAVSQLKIWGERNDVPVIAHHEGADPSSVVFDALSSAVASKVDVVIVDTAGRMHTAKNLMAQIEKVAKVTKPDLKIFVGESITGNDILEQVKSFDLAIGINGIILSKADIDEKGGTALSVGYVTKKPILYLGTGQEYDEIEVFDKEKFIEKLGLDED
jgi:fused signal recognition particle receptor